MKTNSQLDGSRYSAAFLLRDLGEGGAEHSSLRLANGLASAGVKVSLLTLRAQGPLLDEVSPLIERLPPRGERLSFLRLAAELRRLRADFLLPVYTTMRGLMVKPFLSGHTKVVISQRNMFTLDRGPLQTRLRFLRCRALFPLADACVCVSQGVADEMLSLGLLPPDRIHVIYNPVVSERLLAMMDEPLDDPWFAPDAPPVILAVGRLGVQKDFLTLIRAFAAVSAQQPELRLLILGEGSRRTELEEAVHELGLEGRVRMPGYEPNPYRYMRHAALFVLTSLYEGCANVVTEALACGCNVVSANCRSGPSEILADGRYGRLTPVGDPQALAEAMLATLAAPLPREVLMERGAFFSEQRAVDGYLRLFAELKPTR